MQQNSLEMENAMEWFYMKPEFDPSVGKQVPGYLTPDDQHVLDCRDVETRVVCFMSVGGWQVWGLPKSSRT